MTPARLGLIAASVIVALAIPLPASAQGKSGKAHRKTPAPSPRTSALPAPAAGSTQTEVASPFAWMDDASVIAPGVVWLGVSMVRRQGSGVGETIAPVVDGAIGLTSRVQIGASVPRVAGGFGTTFFSAKVAAFADPTRGFKLAVAPTLEILGHDAAVSAPTGRARTQWGLPVSMHVDGDAGRVYGSTGYFSPGIWYVGAGFGKPLTDRVGVSLAFSRAWASASTPAGAIPVRSPRRNEVSGGGSFDVTPGLSLFASLGRTIGLAAQDGAGTTISFGLALTAGPLVFERR